MILFTQNYQACVKFYGQTLGLRQLEQKDGLTKFAFGQSYLLVEIGGVARGREERRDENAVTLRLDVADVDAAAERLRGRGVEVTIRHWDWGITGTMLDPDGNRVELKGQ